MLKRSDSRPLIRHLAAGLALTSVLTLGFATSAFADTAPPAGNPPAAAVKGCQKAATREARLAKLETAIEGRISKWQAAEAKAQSANKTKAARRIERRIKKAQRADGKVQKRLNRLQSRCGGPATGNATTPAPANQ